MRSPAAFEEHGCRPEVRDSQAKTRGITCEKKRRKRHLPSHKQAKRQQDVCQHHHHQRFLHLLRFEAAAADPQLAVAAAGPPAKAGARGSCGGRASGDGCSGA